MFILFIQLIQLLLLFLNHLPRSHRTQRLARRSLAGKGRVGDPSAEPKNEKEGGLRFARKRECSTYGMQCTGGK
jgi:hypothetical protein